MDLSFLGWIVVGLGAGALAKLIMPGKQGGGCFLTLLLGVIGAVIGGFVASWLFPSQDLGIFNIWTWVFAVLGALIVLLIWGLITRGRGGTRA